MTVHRFKVGDLVHLRPGARPPPDESFLDVVNVKQPTGVFEVMRLLPELNNGEPQYRVCYHDGQERVVRESQLVPVTHPQPRR